MRAIILAAGKGKRLDAIRGDSPKCLLEIGGTSLIERQIQALRVVGIDDITIVVGFGKEQVQARCGDEVRYVENEIHEQTNSLYSLWLTRDRLKDGFVVLNADVLFHTQMLADLISAPHENALLVSYERLAPLGDEEMKVKVRDGVVVDISKQMNPVEADGENVGIVKFGPHGAALLVEQMDALVAAGNLKEWAPRAFRAFAASQPLHAISTQGYPWIEIDFPEDYACALEKILPEITMGDAVLR
ncbi:MAG TPA: phosphocholine cytidylyltransferase family protein [Pyrinomonadaceae bacterium]|jgi:choline kinase|nr:phosphocholine cytidylyltransferase family protein [Pyrinomonadaceae bacterium]